MRQLTRSIGDTIFENLGRAAGRFQENRPLPADVLESEAAYLVVFDAPGVTATDVQVRYVEDRVEVRIDRFREFHDGFEMVYPGRGLSLAGSATLPEGATVDTDSATATLRDDGTLQVRIPKGKSEPGSADDDLDDEIDDTVEEADEREDAGTDVGDDEHEDGDSDEDAAADGGRQDETDAEADDRGEDADDDVTEQSEARDDPRQEETDLEE
ncbi:Molecular chaperone IbpA, HSP20 family [Halomicrobium zhouii]|uniref:Molecular chaperone IbpA, HSP20 family n=1 Tax=Halomicrobium zhouii TaxID=767519 RepID=A0A1I6LEV3_9EURY|nr:Hsp20/alpha crystallin family protein [Halomicrobium zhouii]SFS01995.1 Molecular chaperone IbpA, HSP20 family [Halomicrobium zhouii]